MAEVTENPLFGDFANSSHILLTTQTPGRLIRIFKMRVVSVSVHKTVLLAAVLFASNARAQSTQPAPQAQAAQQQQPFDLDVVSIRLNNSDPRKFGGGFTPSGLRLINFPLSQVIYMAYFPWFKGNNVIGSPAWTQNERYDVVGHIDEASLSAWQKFNPRQLQELGRPVLQKLLADRCKLVAHLVPSQADGYALVVSKHGAHLTPAKPDETYPDGVKNLSPDGAKTMFVTQADGIIMRFFNTSLNELADLIGPMSGSVLQDQTGLTGRYDFTLRHLEIEKDPNGKPVISNPEPSDIWDIRSLGLEVKPVKSALAEPRHRPHRAAFGQLVPAYFLRNGVIGNYGCPGVQTDPLPAPQVH